MRKHRSSHEKKWHSMNLLGMGLKPQEGSPKYALSFLNPFNLVFLCESLYLLGFLSL